MIWVAVISEDFIPSRTGRNWYNYLGDPPKALDKYQTSLNIREELRRRAPDSAEIARDMVVSFYKMMTFQQNQNNQQGYMKYAALLKEALLYMKKRGMFMDPPLLQVLKHLEDSGI